MAAHNTIPILHKTISVVQTIAASNGGLTAKNLSVSLKIPPATCYRIIRTLVQHNWLHENGRGEFRLAFGLAHLARSYAEVEHMLNLLEPALRELAQKTELAAKISIREGNHSVTVKRAEPHRRNSISSPIGTTFHLAVGSAGAVLLSSLKDSEIDYIIQTAPAEVWERQTPKDTSRRVAEARKDGISREFGQNHPSIFAISMPVLLSPSLQAAVSLVGWPEDFEGPRLKRIEAQLRKAVESFQQILAAGGMAETVTAKPATKKIKTRS